MHAFPPPQGLYDPPRARRLRRRLRRDPDRRAPATTSSTRRSPRCATSTTAAPSGAEPDTGDGAGILSRSRTRSSARSSTSSCPPRARTPSAPRSCPATTSEAARDPAPHRGARRRGGPRASSAGATCPIDPSIARRHRAGGDAARSASSSSPPRRPARRDGARAAGVLPAQARRARDRRLLPVAVGAHPRLQGHAHHRPARAVLPRPVRRAVRSRALALVHSRFSTNTFPSLAAGPPVPVHRAQRRDQHRQGQPQLDARPRGAAGQRPASPATCDRLFPICTPGASDSASFDEVLELLHLGGRSAAARGADDDPGGVGEPRRDGPGPPGVLRVPRRR